MGAGKLLLALALWAGAAKPLPEPPRDYVHNEGVVSPAAEARLSTSLSAFERETGHQFVVALFASLEGESLEDYSNRLFKHWRVGDAARDDGVLLALFKSDRRWRVEVGYGLESTLTDLEAGRYLNDLAVPRFKAGDFDGGVEAAVAALVARLGGRAPPPQPAPVVPSGESYRSRLLERLEYGVVIVFTAVLVIIILFALFSQGGGGGTWTSGSDWSSGGSSGWDSGSSSSFDSGGFSGGGGSSGGGGASGSW